MTLRKLCVRGGEPSSPFLTLLPMSLLGAGAVDGNFAAVASQLRRL